MTLVGLEYLKQQETRRHNFETEKAAQLDRSSREDIAAKDRASRETISSLDRDSKEAIADADRGSRENIASLDRTSREDIATADRGSRETIAQLDRQIKESIATADRNAQDVWEKYKHFREMEKIDVSREEIKSRETIEADKIYHDANMTRIKNELTRQIAEAELNTKIKIANLQAGVNLKNAAMADDTKRAIAELEGYLQMFNTISGHLSGKNLESISKFAKNLTN